MVKRFLIIGTVVMVFFSAMSITLLGAEELKKPKVYKLTASVIGPGPMGIKKAANIELAAKRLNELLEILDSPVRVQVDVEFSELKWGPFSEKFYMDFKAGKSPDIFTLRETADLAKGGFIVSLDEHIKRFWSSNYYDFYPNVWEGAKWAGKIWGIPHDLSPTGIWYRKDVLRKLGYSDAEINKMLPESGETTLDTVAKLAKEAKDAGLVEFGILHRPSKGSGFYATLLPFGAETYNPKTDRLILNKPAMLEFYRWHARQVEKGVIPPEPSPWKTIHGTFVEGKTFSTWASHVGTPAEWKEKYGLTDEILKRDLGFLPFPPAVPGLLPVSVHDFPLYFVSSQSKHPEIAALIIMLATSPEAAAIHSQFSLRPPYRKSALNHPLIANIDYIQKVASSAEVVRPVPIHPKFWTYMERAFETLKGVEAGIITPAEAVRDLEAFVKTEIPGIEIVE
ncbi:MAG: ABC transporter substrate-binding protein [bacterium]